MKQNIIAKQTGSAVVWVLVLMAIIGVVAAGYWVWQKNQNKEDKKTNTAMTFCKPDNMELTQKEGSSSAGTINQHAVLTNKGTDSCILTGYPAVFLTDADGTVVGNAAVPSSESKPTQQIVAPAGNAHVSLDFPDPGNFPSTGANASACGDKSTNMQMYLPGATTPVQAAWVDQSCPGFTTSPFQSGN